MDDAAAGPSPAPDTAPLTRREQEIARLLARGDTDRQIADALFISVGTVGWHVHRILQKLDLQSRHQVAAWLNAREPHDGAPTENRPKNLESTPRESRGASPSLFLYCGHEHAQRGQGSSMYATIIQCDMHAIASSDGRGQMERALATALGALPGFVAFVALDSDAAARARSPCSASSMGRRASRRRKA